MGTQERGDASRQLLLVLVVAVLAVSLVGTWLVLQTSFSSGAIDSSSGVVNFAKTAPATPVLKAAPESGTVSFVKRA